MALTNAERQKRWIAKNRGLFNLRRRELRRKKLSGVGETGSREAVEAECRQDQPKTCNTSPPSIPFETKKVGEFRMLVMSEERVDDEPTMPVVKPRIFTNDITGQIISERAWNELQRRKRKAKEGGYEIDEHSQ